MLATALRANDDLVNIPLAFRCEANPEGFPFATGKQRHCNTGMADSKSIFDRLGGAQNKQGETPALRSLIITSVREQAREVRSFDLMPEGANGSHGVAFVPGQVAVLEVTGEAPAYFAFASAPEDPDLEVLVKQKAGASRLIFEMEAGSKINLLEVIGNGFALDEQGGKDLIFVAMGTGVAPLRSALRHVLKRKDEFGQLVVLYGARTPDDFCFRDETSLWQDAGVELRQVVSKPDGHDWSGPTGYVQSLLDHVLPNLSSPVALICGSPEMMEQTRGRLAQMGFAPNEILTNY